MSQPTGPEAWLRGAIDGVPPLLLPAAHSLVQAREDVAGALDGLNVPQIWTRLGDAASVGFHVRHLAGALDRLLTYARGEALTEGQLRAAAREAEPGEPPADAATLLAALEDAVERALEQVRSTPEATLLEPRAVGRQRLPSTVLGLVFHAAEHATRHAGQAITTARIVRSGWPAR